MKPFNVHHVNADGEVKTKIVWAENTDIIRKDFAGRKLRVLKIKRVRE